VIGAIVRIAVILLVAFGVFGAIERSLDASSVLADGKPASGIARLDERRLTLFAGLFGVSQESPEFMQMRASVARATGKFHEHPRKTIFHVVAGSLFLTFALLQFAPSIRTRHPALHRNSGRVLLVLVLALSLSGLYFGLFHPYAGALERSAVAVFGGFMLFAGSRAWIAIRRRQVALHREWMIRMFATGLAIACIRVFAALASFVIPVGPELVAPQTFGLTLWGGWVATLLAAEGWIRATRGSALVKALQKGRPAEAGRPVEA